MSFVSVLITTEKPVHLHCFACGSASVDGLRLIFSSCGDNKVSARLTAGEAYQGHPGVEQGGIVPTTLDSATTNCLFAANIQAMTARLNVQYHLPVLVGQILTVEAELVCKRGRLCELEAGLTQGYTLKAAASGRFMVPNDAL